MTIVIGIKGLSSIDAVIKMYKAIGVELTKDEALSYPNTPEYEKISKEWDEKRKNKSLPKKDLDNIDEEYMKRLGEAESDAVAKMMCPKVEEFIFEPKYNPHAGNGNDTIEKLPIWRILFGISIPNGSTSKEIARVSELLENKFKSLDLPPVLVYIASFDE